MALDLFSNTYLTHRQKLTFDAIPRQLRVISAWNNHYAPETSAAINSHVDVLEGFHPIDAGCGGLLIKAHGIGKFNIAIRAGAMVIEVAPLDPVIQDFVHSVAVFRVSHRGLVFLSLEGLAFARRILRYVNLRHERYGEIAPISAVWNQTLDQTPGRRWVALRETAIKAGHEPPRACHWMAAKQ